MKQSELEQMDGKCLWYIVIKRGKTFDDTNRQNELICYRCNGSKECGDKLGCDRFITNDANYRLPRDYQDWINNGNKRRIGEHTE